MSFLSSSISSSSLSLPPGSTSSLHSHSVYPSFLPVHGIHSLYTTILETPTVLHAIEEIPLFREDTISYKMIHLFHGILWAQCQLHAAEQPLDDHHLLLHMSPAKLPLHVLTALHLHRFRTFFSMLPLETIYPLSHYRENCPSYTCPHCHLSTPGHPSSACLQYQCGFCHNWGHHGRFSPHQVCGSCNTPGQMLTDCPAEHLSPLQLSTIFGGP